MDLSVGVGNTGEGALVLKPGKEVMEGATEHKGRVVVAK